MPDMAEKYKNEIVQALKKKLDKKNVMEVPRLVKIVLSSGINSDKGKEVFTESRKHLAMICGQQPLITKARKNVSNFKLRIGMDNGLVVNLRGSKMYEFMDRLVHNALPRVRDFRGIPRKGFDGSGNYNLGIDDVSIFTEVDLDKLKNPFGINVTIVTTAETDEDAFELLKMFEMPFKEK